MPAPTTAPRPTAADRIRAATWFADRGFGVFSVWSADADGRCRCPKGAACGSPGKHPIGRQGFLEHTRDPERIRTLLSAGSEPNYGLVCPDGVLVLDVDGDGVARLAELEARLGALPATLRTNTAHGQHIFLRWPEGLPRPLGQMFGYVTRWGSGTGAGYVIGPRSVHATGFEYAPAGTFLDIAELPEAWARAAIEAKPAAGSIAVKPGGPTDVAVGSRHEYLRDQARHLRGLGLTGDALLAAVSDLNRQLAEPKTADAVRRAIGDVETKFGRDAISDEGWRSAHPQAPQAPLSAATDRSVALSAISTDPPPPMLVDRLDPTGHTILYGTGGIGTLRPLEVEAFLLHETLGHGGTCDLIAELDGEVWLLDWKTGASVATPDGAVYRDHRLQLAAYANAEFIARPDDPERHPVPAITRYGVVHVTDGGTRLHEAAVTPRDWVAFRACLALHAWSKERAA